jgi:hypothetical protein
MIVLVIYPIIFFSDEEKRTSNGDLALSSLKAAFHYADMGEMFYFTYTFLTKKNHINFSTLDMLIYK